MAQRIPTGGLNLSGALPMDSVPGVTWQGCYGVGALTYKWKRGKLFDMIVGGNTYTISAVNGFPDIKRIAALLGINYKTGVKGALISKWYDQSGNGNDCTQATTLNQPSVWLINGQISLGFGGVLSKNVLADGQHLTIPSGVSINNQSSSIFTLIKPYTTSCATQSLGGCFSTPLITTGCLLTNTSTLGVGSAGPESFNIDVISAFAGVHLTPATKFGTQKSVWGYVLGGSTSLVSCNEVSSSTSALVAGTATGGFIGGKNGTFAPSDFSGRMYAILFSSSIFTTNQQTQIRNALYSYGSVKSQVATTVKTNIMIDGASFDENQGGDPTALYNTQNGGGYGWAEMLQDALSNYAIQWQNMSSSGATVANVTSNYGATLGGSNCFNASSGRNILIAPGVAYGNSVNAGRTGAQTYTDFTTWLTAVKAQSWDKIVCYLVPNNAANADVATFISSMQTNAVSNGIVLVDMTADGQLGTGSFVNADGHPTIAGYQKMAAYLIPVVRALL